MKPFLIILISMLTTYTACGQREGFTNKAIDKDKIDTVLGLNKKQRFIWMDCSLDTFYFSHQRERDAVTDMELQFQQNNKKILDSIVNILKSSEFDSCMVLITIYRTSGGAIHCDFRDSTVLKDKLITYGIDGAKIRTKSKVIILSEKSKLKPKTTVVILRYSKS